ncbi:PREDICTED: B3 domain-containing transcription factor NGA4-like [Populus euphratica]|uniref:B3 domain-containing transcription factor NGA4-like n=1 Tax=Populus euphratica TaxID=75702 RepID=A0AAJ6T438_POPEU|nr:PREDICTED: B3 domain-containing transcription factor NGA4-like [Populus euphratica]
MAVFSKILRETDTKKRLSVPIRFLRSLPPFKLGSHAVTFDATDEKGKAWTFQCSTRKRGQYPKPVLTRGWVAFVKSKKLQVGDKVMFIKRENCATATISYKVRAEKAIKIFGATFGYARI